MLKYVDQCDKKRLLTTDESHCDKKLVLSMQTRPELAVSFPSMADMFSHWEIY